jgi:trigger factor
LNDDDSIKAGGIMNSSTISMEFVEDKKLKKELIGKGKGDKVIVDPAKVSRGEKDTAAMLGVKEEELATLSKNFQLTITEIKQMELSDINQDLFDKLFGPGAISSEKELRERIATDLENMFAQDSDRLFTRNVYTDLVEKTKMTLPDAFLKRWIRLSNEKPITADQIELEYDGYAKSLKWQLIQGNIFKTNNIRLDNNEVIDFTKGLLASNYAQYGMPAPEDKVLTESAIQVLQNKEESTRIFDMLAEQKLTNFFKETVKLNQKEISYDAFIELASK